MEQQKLQNWKFTSSETEGFYTVVSPENSECKTTWAFRLNLSRANDFELKNDKLELNGAVVSGDAEVTFGNESYQLGVRDSFYLPGGASVKITAKSGLVMFLGGAPYYGQGEFFIRKYDLTLPLGDIHQVHGKPPYQREVLMTVAQQDIASRLICGITEGEPGKWTSWPPHQHSKDLEEIYCYFDIPKPQFALHLASRKAGEVETVFPVSFGDFVIVPEGYHPTVGMPGVRSCYFWIMAAFSEKSRRYDLAVNDPSFEE